MKQELALQNLFMFLVEKGFPLAVRDYEDALQALGKGYGLHSKENLLWLCRTLWARTDEEVRFLDALFNQFSFPADEKTKDLIDRSKSSSGSDTNSNRDSKEPIRFKDDKIPRESQPAAPAVNFAPAANQEDGIGLTRARVEPTVNEYFILSPRLIVSLRRLTLIWRRFRAAKREGPKVELDLEATIEEKCRRGLLDEPVLIPARRNQAKIVIIVDVSTSMTPWQEFNKVLVKSLQRGQLGGAEVFYFHNIPDEDLYERETLIKPRKVAEVLKDNQNSTLLIVSDCGAARGFQSRERVRDTKKFLKEASRFWHPVVWLNPMPVSRWKNTTAETVNKSLKVNMHELNEEGLIKAIDVLRGKRFK